MPRSKQTHESLQAELGLTLAGGGFRGALGPNDRAAADRDRANEDDDDREEDRARRRRSETDPAGGDGLREQIAEGRAERSRQDVRDPERDDPVDLEDEVGDRGRCDESGEEERRERIAEVRRLGDQIARRRAECERREDRRPIEELAAGGAHVVNGKRLLAAIPRCEDDGERASEDERRRLERDAVGVDQRIGDERPDHADEHDDEPVDPRDIAPPRQLHDERDYEENRHDDRRDRQTELQRDVEVVRERLADRRRQDLDRPERQRDRRDFVHHRRRNGSGRRTLHDRSMRQDDDGSMNPRWITSLP